MGMRLPIKLQMSPRYRLPSSFHARMAMPPYDKILPQLGRKCGGWWWWWGRW
jgi:hypothetical protein